MNGSTAIFFRNRERITHRCCCCAPAPRQIVGLGEPYRLRSFPEVYPHGWHVGDPQAVAA